MGRLIEVARALAAPPPRRRSGRSVAINQHLGNMQSGLSNLYFKPKGGPLQVDLAALGPSDFRMMKTHPQAKLCLDLLSFYMHGLEYEVKCPDSPEIERVADELMHQRAYELSRTMSRAAVYGFSPNVLDWEVDPHSKYYVVGAYRDLVPETCRVYVGDTVAEQEANIYQGFKQGIEHIQPEDSLWYPLLMESGDWYGQSLLRSAAVPIFFSEVMHQYANQYYERCGVPTLIGHAPFDKDVETSDGTTMRGSKAMEAILDKIRNAARVTLPTDRDLESNYEFDLKYLESNIGHAVEFEKYMDRLDMEIAYAILTPTLVFNPGKVGSYNAAEVHTGTWNMLLRGLAADRIQYKERYILARIVKYNWGENTPKATLNYKKSNFISDEMINAWTQALISGGLAKPELEQFSEHIGFELEKIEKPEQAVQPQQAQQPQLKAAQAAPEVITLAERVEAPTAFTPERELTEIESPVDFARAVRSLDKGEAVLRSETRSALAKMQEDLEGKIRDAYAKKNRSSAYRKIKLAQVGRFKAGWRRAALLVYDDGREQMLAEASLKSSDSTTPERAKVLAHAETMSEKQLADIQFSVQSALARSVDKKRDVEATVAAAVAVFAEFSDTWGPIELAGAELSTWAINQGRWDAAAASAQTVYGYAWSAILDGRECLLCRYLGWPPKIITPTSPYWGKLMPPVHFRCFDDQTDVYTSEGWKRFADLHGSEEILSLNPDTHSLEWAKQVRRVQYEHTGSMVHFTSRSMDLMVTPDHDMHVGVRVDHGKAGRRVEWQTHQAKDLLGMQEFTIPRTGKWDGVDPENITVGGLTFDAETFCKFMGYYLSEGSVSQRSPKCYQISITQHNGGAKVIADELRGMPIKVSLGQDKLYLFHVGLGEYLTQFGKSHQKFVPDEIKRLSPRLINLFLDAYTFGDGTVYSKPWPEKALKSSARHISTSSTRMADDIGELFLKVGKFPSFSLEKRKGRQQTFKNGTYTMNHDLWQIRECHSKTAVHSRSARSGVKLEEVDYDGEVFCVELDKNHILWVRRNGRTAFAGNCRCIIIPIFSPLVGDEGELLSTIPEDLLPYGGMLELFSKEMSGCLHS